MGLALDNDLSNVKFKPSSYDHGDEFLLSVVEFNRSEFPQVVGISTFGNEA